MSTSQSSLVLGGQTVKEMIKLNLGNFSQDMLLKIILFYFF